MQVIIFEQAGGGVSVITPVQDTGLTIEEVAAKDVPANTAWRIVNSEDLPSYDSRDRWRWTDSGALAVADPVVTVPASISKVQFVRAARAADLWDTYKTAIEAHADWAYVTEIPRTDPMVLALASGLGFTEEQLDALWIAGAQL